MFEGIKIKATKTQRYHMVGQSKSSAYASAPMCSASGFSSLEDAIAELAEGGYVMDKRDLSWEQACLCISGPMESASLPPLTISDLWEKARTFESMEAFFAYLETRESGLSMTSMSLDLFCEWWRRQGAKVGRKIKGKVVWRPAYSGPLFPVAPWGDLAYFSLQPWNA